MFNCPAPGKEMKEGLSCADDAREASILFRNG
jgi:hypothetical protein